MRKKILLVFISLLILAACGSVKKTKTTEDFKIDKTYISLFHEGVRLKMRGQTAESIQAFEKCLTINSKDDAVWFALSGLYLLNNQAVKSIESIKKAAALDPANSWYEQELAYAYYGSKNYTEASKSFQKLTTKEPKNVELLFAYAESLMLSKDVSGAIKVLDKLQSQTGTNPELSLEKFRLYRQIKQDDKAVNEIKKALIDFPSHPQLLANLVDFYFEKKQADDAFQYLVQLAEADPANGNAHMALAQYYDQKGKRKESYESLKKAFLSVDIPLDNKMKTLLSMLDVQVKIAQEMIELAQILTTQYPEDSKAYAILGDIYLKNDQAKESLENFQKALKYDQSKYVIWDQVLIMEYQNQDFDQLYVDSKKAIELFPTMIAPYLLHAISANQTKKHQEAIETIDSGIDLIVNDKDMKSEFLAQKGEAYFKLKDNKEAVSNYEQALRLSPSKLFIMNNFAYQSALYKVNLVRAEQLIEQVLASYPKDPRYLDTYGLILFQQGKYQEANAQFEKALVANPKDALILEHLGDVQFHLGNKIEAVKLWENAKSLGAKNKNLDRKIEQKKYEDPLY
jgi:tetratricopeptide (TPR) repeat protein